MCHQFDNVKVLINHHSEYVKSNLPASALVEEEAAKDGEPAEELKV